MGLTVKDKQGTAYPNRQSQQMNRRHCEAAGLCYYCFGRIPQCHQLGACPSPAYKENVSPHSAAALANACVDVQASTSEHAAQCLHAHTSVEQPQVAEQPLAQCHSSIAATLQAEPFNINLLFVGAVQHQESNMKVTVMLYTGSSHNVCSPNVSKLKQSITGRKYSVSCAGSQHQSTAVEHSYGLSIQSNTMSTCFDACEMLLWMHNVDAWCRHIAWSNLTQHKAALLTWTGQLDFLIRDQGLPGCWRRQKRLQYDPLT